MSKYLAIYENRNSEIVSTATFEAPNIKKAKEFAQLHKNRTREIYTEKGVKTTVRKKA